MLFPVGFEIRLNPFDGVELAGVQIGIRNLEFKRLLKRRDEVGQGERVEEAGVEKRLVFGRRDRLTGDPVQDLIDFRSFVH